MRSRHNASLREWNVNVIVPARQRRIPDSFQLQTQIMKEIQDEKPASVQEMFGDAVQKADFEAKARLMQSYQAAGIGKASVVSVAQVCHRLCKLSNLHGSFKPVLAKPVGTLSTQISVEEVKNVISMGETGPSWLKNANPDDSNWKSNAF